jgi:acyl-CoA reductase-like NAD-dependent aldehyde dehydrogenase
MTRIPVTKTFKLYINGKFPRTESGRSLAVKGRNGTILAHICRASRKDLRDAVESARGGGAKWGEATAYNRGQVLYRMAEMLEGRAEDFVTALTGTGAGTAAAARKEVAAAVDRLVCFSGWADKYPHILGSRNPVAGPYYNFTTPEPTGVVGVVCPDEPALLGLVSLVAPPLCAGNGLVVVAGEKHPLPAVLFAEVCATSDVPAGAINILTAKRGELLEHVAQHREVNAIAAANVGAEPTRVLRRGAAENIKRVHVVKRSGDQWLDADECESPWTIEPFVEMKTIWHPSAS